jgi:mannose-6-phosphate isomerase-like protein (cupin superfamily)
MGIAALHPSYAREPAMRTSPTVSETAEQGYHRTLREGADDPREAVMNQPQPVKDASSLYEVERRAEHAARPGFRITELQLSATQKVPWHTHSNVSDTFYVLDGQMRLFLQDPKEEVNLKPGEVYVVKPTRPHLVTNGGAKSLTFLILQGVGEYDFVPLLGTK